MGKDRSVRGKTVLIAEDNPTFAGMIAQVLRGVAGEVVVTRDGVEALDYLFGRGAYAGRDTSDAPCVVLLDLIMPRLGGLDVLRRLRADERTKLLPVVIFSSSDDPQCKLDCYASGANSYIVKSSPFATFPEMVRYTVRYWIELNETPPGSL